MDNYNNTPLGSIVSSILPWRSLLVSLQNDSPFSAESTSWAPCDGRNIEGSALADLGLINAPDLRGTFLRGLNEFAEDSTKTLDKLQRDPSIGRKSGNLQHSAIATHSHTYLHSAADRKTKADGGGGVAGLWQFGSFNKERSTGAALKRDGSVEESSETRPTNVAVYFYVRIN